MTTAMNSTKELNDNEMRIGDEWICQLLTVEGAIGGVGNLMVCFVILRVKFLHNMTNYLLVNLALADMLACLLEFVYYLIVSPNCRLVRYVPASSWEKELFCRLLFGGYLTWTFCYTSAYSLCLVTLERYVAIVHPLKYAKKLSAKRIKTLLVFIWVISFVAPIPFLLVSHQSEDPNNTCSDIQYPTESFAILVGVEGFLFSFALPIVFMSLAYYKMQITLKRQAAALNLQYARAAAYDLVVARQRLVHMLTIVLGVLILLWMPIYIDTIMCLHPTDGTFLSCGSEIHAYVRGIANFLFYFNSVINLVIYEFKYKKFRQGFKVAFCSCHNRQGGNRIHDEMAPRN